MIFINNSISIGFVVLNEKADIIFAAFIEVLLCTSEGIEVFYFHDVLEVMGKGGLFFVTQAQSKPAFTNKGESYEKFLICRFRATLALVYRLIASGMT